MTDMEEGEGLYLITETDELHSYFRNKWAPYPLQYIMFQCAIQACIYYSCYVVQRLVCSFTVG